MTLNSELKFEIVLSGYFFSRQMLFLELVMSHILLRIWLCMDNDIQVNMVSAPELKNVRTCFEVENPGVSFFFFWC